MFTARDTEIQKLKLFDSIRMNDFSQIKSLASLQNQNAIMINHTPIAYAAFLYTCRKIQNKEVIHFLLEELIKPQKEENVQDKFQLGKVIMYLIHRELQLEADNAKIRYFENLVRALFEYGAILEKCSIFDDGKNIFHYLATAHEYINVLRMALIHSPEAFLDMKDKSGKIPLEYAISSNNFAAITEFITRVNQLKSIAPQQKFYQDSVQTAALFTAIEMNNCKMVKVLATPENQASLSKDNETPIVFSVRLNHVKIINLLLYDFVFPNKSRNKNDVFQLGKAISHRVCEAVNVKNFKHFNNLNDLINQLFAGGAIFKDHTYFSEDGKNVLHLIAGKTQFHSTLQLLLAHSPLSFLTMEDKDKKIPLDYAIAAQDDVAITTLSERRRFFDLLLIEKQQKEIFFLLLQLFENVNLPMDILKYIFAFAAIDDERFSFYTGPELDSIQIHSRNYFQNRIFFRTQYAVEDYRSSKKIEKDGAQFFNSKIQAIASETQEESDANTLSKNVRMKFALFHYLQSTPDLPKYRKKEKQLIVSLNKFGALCKTSPKGINLNNQVTGATLPLVPVYIPYSKMNMFAHNDLEEWYVVEPRKLLSERYKVNA